MAARLGSVFDPNDRADGPRGRLTVDVLEEWLKPRSVLEIVVPRRLTCARCDGGGCDACDRSGAIRIEGDDQARRFRLTLSEPARGLRLIRPLGEDAGLDQLLLELRPAEAPSDLCHHVETRGFVSPAVLVGVALAVAAILAAMLGR